MRYQVRFDLCGRSWLVIDTRAGGRVVGRYETSGQARRGAWDQEERWYKCSGEGSRKIRVGAG